MLIFNTIVFSSLKVLLDIWDGIAKCTGGEQQWIVKH